MARTRMARHPYPSLKAPVDHAAAATAEAMTWIGKVRHSSEQQEGTLWQRKMRTLATRRTRNAIRRHASGKPMKRGAPKRGR